MTALEELLLHAQTQSLALNKAAKVLAETLALVEQTKETIQRLQGENEVLRLNLQEAREGRAVRQ